MFVSDYKRDLSDQVPEHSFNSRCRASDTNEVLGTWPCASKLLVRLDSRRRTRLTRHSQCGVSLVGLFESNLIGSLQAHGHAPRASFTSEARQRLLISLYCWSFWQVSGTYHTMFHGSLRDTSRTMNVSASQRSYSSRSLA